MIRSTSPSLWAIPLLLVAFAADVHAQQPPYDVFPPADPPYYRVRYEASTQKGELAYPVNYTIWVPKSVKSLRGVIVHQHGCGEGSCKSGLTGAYDLHWQALAKKHDCALLSPSYEQPDKGDCQMWCDPRNGSDAAFQKCLVDLGAKAGHPELAKLPWALWGHSGGGHWAGGMVLLHPERVAAAWLRSGVPMLKANAKSSAVKAHALPDPALKVPMMCNLGTKEGVTEKGKQFAGVWPANEAFFNEVRGKGGLIGVAIDPLTSHECGNQRYLAIPWLDACLSARLPKHGGDPLKAMPTDQAWLAPITGGEAVPAAKLAADPLKAAWLPNEAIAKAWMQYVKDTAVTDSTPPPAPTNVRLKGNELTWEAEADVESGLASFIIERDGKFLAKVPEQGKNPFGRPVFQNLQYSDTPPQPLVPIRYIDMTAEAGKKHAYRVIAVNTVGLKSKPGEGEKEIIGAIERLDPRFDKLIPKEAQLEKIAEGYIWTEGAVWYKPGKCLLFSDIPNNVVVKWEPGKGPSEFLKPSGYTGLKPRGGKAGDEPGSNGLAVDSQGRLYLCEHGDRRVTRIEKDGKKTILADNYMGKKLNSPNDLALHPNGDVYFTDPPYGLAKGDKRELDFTGVFRISGKDGTLSLVSRTLNPNGITLSPDHKKLYVTNGGSWVVFPVNDDGTTGESIVFVNPKQWKLTPAKGGGIDGLKCDVAGNIFATGPGGVCVIAPDGTLLGRFLCEDRTANLCFGGEDGRTLFVCVNHRIGMVRTTTKGIGW